MVNRLRLYMKSLMCRLRGMDKLAGKVILPCQLGSFTKQKDLLLKKHFFVLEENPFQTRVSV